MDLEHANEQNSACGLKAMQWAPPAGGLHDALGVVKDFLTRGRVGKAYCLCLNRMSFSGLGFKYEIFFLFLVWFLLST